jgi:hypothetical protein
MEEMGIAVDLLPLALNFPTNLPVRGLANHDVDPAVIHYHGNLDSAGRLNPIGLPKVDAAIVATNALMADQAQSALMQDYHRRIDQANGVGERARTQLSRVLRKLRKTART